MTHFGSAPNLLTELQAILRVALEPSQVVTEWQVHRLLTDRPADYQRFMRTQLEAIAAGRVQLELPPKQLFTDPDAAGDFRVMPCVTRGDGRITKTVKLVGTNLRQRTVPDQITVGRAFALDPHENFITHSFEACLLSSARTGLCAALGTQLLAEGGRTVGIVGAGRVGWYAGYYLCAAQAPQEIRIHDCNAQRARAVAGSLQAALPGVRIVAAGATEVRDVDTLVLASTSREPLVGPQETRATLVVSLGADTDEQSELTDAWAGAADIHVDTQDSARFGDLRRWLERGLLRGEDVTDVFALLRDGARRPAGRPRVFVSTGSALFDNLTIAYLLERLAAA